MTTESVRSKRLIRRTILAFFSSRSFLLCLLYNTEMCNKLAICLSLQIDQDNPDMNVSSCS